MTVEGKDGIIKSIPEIMIQVSQTRVLSNTIKQLLPIDKVQLYYKIHSAYQIA